MSLRYCRSSILEHFLKSGFSPDWDHFGLIGSGIKYWRGKLSSSRWSHQLRMRLKNLIQERPEQPYGALLQGTGCSPEEEFRAQNLRGA